MYYRPYIDGKVKCRKNDTLTWLVAKPSDEQEKIILFSIAEAKAMRAQLKKREENIAKIQGQLFIEKRQHKDSSCRRRLEKKLNLVLTNNAELSEVVPELSIEQTETVRNVISNMSILNSLYIGFTEHK